MHLPHIIWDKDTVEWICKHRCVCVVWDPQYWTDHTDVGIPLSSCRGT